MITEGDFIGALFLEAACRCERRGGLTSDAKVQD
jgi:hypothetical protein